MQLFAVFKLVGRELHSQLLITLFILDRWWNPAIEDQATDRVHRIGQDKTVYVYRITNTGTLEEKIALLLRWGQGVENTSALEAEVESTPCIG